MPKSNVLEILNVHNNIFHLLNNEMQDDHMSRNNAVSLSNPRVLSVVV